MLKSRVVCASVLLALALPFGAAHAINVRDDQVGNNLDNDPNNVLYPFVVRISVGCTGTLIDRRTILTAAHCVVTDGNVWTAGANTRVTFRQDGQFNISDVFGSGTIIHPNYVDPPGNAIAPNDVAIIYLDTPVTDVAPITLATADPAAGAFIWITGHGVGGSGTNPGSLPSGPRRFGTNLIDNIVGDGVGAVITYDFDDPLSDPAATLFEGESDPGDSGGPMLVPDGFGGFIQVGIVSGGAQGYGGTSVYASVASYINFIDLNRGLVTSFANSGNGNWTDVSHWNSVIFGSSGNFPLPLAPDNYDQGAPFLQGTVARYFDVFLQEAGTTTIEDGDIIDIDRLTIDHAAAVLDIENGGSLEVILDTLIADGILDVDGQFSTLSLLQTGGLLTAGTTGGVSVAQNSTVLSSVWDIGGSLDTGELTMFASTLDVTGGDVGVAGNAFLRDTPLTVFSGGRYSANQHKQVRGDITVHDGGELFVNPLTSSDNTIDVSGHLSATSLVHDLGAFNVWDGGNASISATATLNGTPLSVFGDFGAFILEQINGDLTVHDPGKLKLKNSLLAVGNTVRVDGELTTGALSHSDGVFNVTGTVEVKGGNAGFGQTPVTVAPGGTLTAGSLNFHLGDASIGGTAISDGPVLAESNTIDLTGLLGGATLSHAFGVLNIAGGGVADFSGDATLESVSADVDPGAVFNADTLNVDGGSFLHDGVINANLVELDDGALFAGNGTVNGTLANSWGHVLPGSSIGTIVIAGDYIQGPAGMLSIETTALEIDLLDVGGQASLAGTLNVSLLGPQLPRAGDMLTFINADGGVTGTFGTLNFPILPGLLFYDVAYNANDVMLITDVESYVPWAPAEPALTIANVVDQFDRKAIDPDLREILDFLDLNPDFIEESLTTWNPTDIHVFPKTMSELTGLLSDQFSRRITRVLTGNAAPVEVAMSGMGNAVTDIAPAQRRIVMSAAAAASQVDVEHPWTPAGNLPNDMGVFLAGDVALGSGETITGPDSDFSALAITAGFDSRIGRHAMLGAAISYTSANSDLAGSGEYEGEGVLGSLYGALWHGGFHLDAFGGWGDLNVTTARPIIAGLERYVAKGDVDGSQLHAAVNAGYVFGAERDFKFGPALRYRYTRLSIDSYSETGDGADLTFDANTPVASTLGAGVQLGHDFRWGENDRAVTAYLRATSEWEFADESHVAVARFTGAPAHPFEIVGVPWDSHYYSLHVGFNGELNEHVAFRLSYETDFGRDDLDSHRVSGTLRWGF